MIRETKIPIGVEGIMHVLIELGLTPEEGAVAIRVALRGLKKIGADTKETSEVGDRISDILETCYEQDGSETH